MFPEESFGPKKLEGLDLKVLRSGEDQDPNAKLLIVSPRKLLKHYLSQGQTVMIHKASLAVHSP